LEAKAGLRVQGKRLRLKAKGSRFKVLRFSPHESEILWINGFRFEDRSAFGLMIYDCRLLIEGVASPR